MAVRIEDVDKAKLEELQGKMVGDVAGGLGILMAYIGDRRPDPLPIPIP